MQITLFGCKIYISLLFITMLTLILLLDKTGVMLFGLIAAAIHESGHLAVMILTDNRPNKIELMPYGIIIIRPTKIISPKDELMIAVAGCTANLATGLVFLSIYFLCGFEEWIMLCGASFCTMGFNLMIIKGLDGYDILNNLLSRRWEDKSEKICRIISILNTAVIIGGCIFTFSPFGGSIMMMICVTYLIILSLLGNKQYKKSA